MHALIDGDILVYRIGYSTEDVPERLAKIRLRDYFESILENLLVSDHTTYLTSTDKSNYRFALDPTYKGNRTQPKPKHYDFLRHCLIDNNYFNSTVVLGKEADDAMGIRATSFNNLRDFIIVTIDKDLKQIQGWHYDFVKNRKYYINKATAARFIYYQLLVGDSADNIGGITGIGDATATKLLEHCSNDRDCFRVVHAVYSEVDSLDNLILRGRLLKIQQNENEPLWLPPELSSEELKEGASHLIKVDWKKSFMKYSRIQEKKKELLMNQSECTSSIPPSLPTTSPTG